MGIDIENIIKKFRIFLFTYWAMMLSVSGMYTMYILKMGFTKQEISVTVTIFTMSSLIGQSIFGYFVDKFRNLKKVLLLSISVGLIFAVLLFFVNSNWQIYVLIFLWGFFLYGTVPLTEVWCIENLKANNGLEDFGKVRGFGSIGFGLSGAVIGFLLQFLGWKVYYIYIFIAVCFTLFTIYLIKEDAVKIKEMVKENREISTKEAFKEIVKIKPLISMVILVFVYVFVVKGIYSYLGILVSDYGGGPLSLGLTYFFDATPEVVTFFLTVSLLRRFNAKRIIFAAFLLQILRLLLILIFNNALSVMLLGTLSGFAFGLLAASYKTYIYELAPSKYKTSCMSLCESIIGFAGVISAPVFGFIFTKYGGWAAISVGLIIFIISGFVILKNMLQENKRLIT